MVAGITFHKRYPVTGHSKGAHHRKLGFTSQLIFKSLDMAPCIQKSKCLKRILKSPQNEIAMNDKVYIQLGRNLQYRDNNKKAILD